MEQYINTLSNILKKDFTQEPLMLKQFIINHNKEIINALTNKEIFDLTVKVVNILGKEKKYYLQIVYLELLNQKIENNNILFTLAEAFYKIKGYKESLNYLNKISFKDFKIEHQKLLANIYYQSQDFIKCIKTINKIRNLEGDDVHKILMLIHCHRRVKNIKEAENEFNKLSNYKIEKIKTLILKCQILIAKGDFKSALIIVEENYNQYSDDIEFLEVYSLILKKYRRYNDALKILQQAKALGHTGYYSQAYSIELSNRNYSIGFENLVQATKNNLINNYFKSKKIKEWEGENLNNKNLFLYSGEGIALGDKIYFFRFILHTLGFFEDANIYFCINSLREMHLFKHKKVHIIELNNAEKYIDESKSNYFSSLPLLTLINIKKGLSIDNHKNFISSNNAKNEFWKNYFKRYQTKINIGLNWKGDIKFKLDIYRSLSLDNLNSIFENNFNFFVLNENITDDEQLFLKKYKNIFIIDKNLLLDEKNHSFIDTIAIMKNMDVILTTDTALAHLAFSLNLKTFLMLEFSPFWYWDVNEKENLYKNLNAKFFNQPSPGNWDFVIKKVNEELKLLN